MNNLNFLSNYRFDTAINSHLITHQKEYLCLAALKYCYPKKYSSFEHSDAPDLIDKRHSIGIEVVEIANPVEKEINSKFNKLCISEHSRSRSDVKIIREKDGTTITLTPTHRSLDLRGRGIECLRATFRARVLEKIQKSNEYTNKVHTIGLMLVSDLLPTEATEKWVEWIKDDLQRSTYDFVYLLSPQQLDVFYCKSNWRRKKRICKNDYQALKVLSRLTAEKADGIIEYWR